jgi:hypothetical protein
VGVVAGEKGRGEKGGVEHGRQRTENR